MAPKVDIKTYVMEVKKKMNLDVSEEIIEKDFILTLVLAEFENRHRKRINI